MQHFGWVDSSPAALVATSAMPAAHVHSVEQRQAVAPASQPAKYAFRPDCAKAP